MARLLALLALPLALAACSAGEPMNAHDLELQLEARGFGDELFQRVRCRAGTRGWTYVCTYRRVRELRRMKGAFLVDQERIKAGTGSLALDLPIGPAPNHADAERWDAFVGAATAICSKRRSEIQKLPPARGRAELVARLGRAALIQQAELFQLDALTAPAPAEARRLHGLLRWERALLRASAVLRDALSSRNAEAARVAAGDVELASRRLDKRARSLGLTACAQTR